MAPTRGSLLSAVFGAAACPGKPEAEDAAAEVRPKFLLDMRGDGMVPETPCGKPCLEMSGHKRERGVCSGRRRANRSGTRCGAEAVTGNTSKIPVCERGAVSKPADPEALDPAGQRGASKRSAGCGRAIDLTVHVAIHECTGAWTERVVAHSLSKQVPCERLSPEPPARPLSQPG